MRTPPTCPVVISSVTQSKEFGFQALTVNADSSKAIESVYLTVVLVTGEREEVVDGGHVFVKLEPGDRKNVDVFLGRIQALTQRAKELRQQTARAIVFVDSVDFSDGSKWDPREPLLDIPLDPTTVRPRQ